MTSSSFNGQCCLFDLLNTLEQCSESVANGSGERGVGGTVSYSHVPMIVPQGHTEGMNSLGLTKCQNESIVGRCADSVEEGVSQELEGVLRGTDGVESLDKWLVDPISSYVMHTTANSSHCRQSRSPSLRPLWNPNESSAAFRNSEAQSDVNANASRNSMCPSRIDLPFPLPGFSLGRPAVVVDSCDEKLAKSDSPLNNEVGAEPTNIS